MSQRDRLREPVVQQQAVGQPGHDVVLRQVGHLSRRLERGADIAKHNHGAGHPSIPIVNGRGRVLDLGFAAVAADEDTVRGETHGFVEQHGQDHRVPRGFPRLGE